MTTPLKAPPPPQNNHFVARLATTGAAFLTGFGIGTTQESTPKAPAAQPPPAVQALIEKARTEGLSEVEWTWLGDVYYDQTGNEPDWNDEEQILTTLTP